MRKVKQLKILVALLILFTTAAAANGEVLLTVKDSSGNGSINLPVAVSSAVGMTGLQFKLQFDPTLMSVPDKRVVTLGALTKGWSIKSNHGEGWVTVVMFNPRLQPLKEGKGTVANVSLKISDEAAEGLRIPIKLTNVVVADDKGNAMSSAVKGGTFTKRLTTEPTEKAE